MADNNDSQENKSDTGIPPVAGSPPAENTGDSGKGNGERKYTQADFDQRFRGQGKQLEEMKAEVESLKAEKAAKEQAALEEKGEFKTIAEKATKELAEMAAKNQAMTERETARVELVKVSNEQRMKDLPKELLDLIPDYAEPDQVAIQLSKLEAIHKSNVVDVHGGGGRSNPPQTPEKELEEMQNNLKDAFFKKDKK